MTTTIAPQIAAFAAAVREALADLPADERDELTDGLEADLAEAYAEDLTNTLPDPLEYATELRLAAGLPLSVEPKPSVLAGLTEGWARTRHDIMAALRRNPVLGSALEFMSVLRPAWWLLRAWVAVWCLAAVFGSEGGLAPTSVFWFVLLIGAVVVSVQWGRGRWTPAPVPLLIVVGNVVAALLAYPALALANDHANYGADDYEVGYQDGIADVAEPEEGGLSFKGQPLENVYVYDAEGNLLRDVQLFDVRGNRLEVSRMTEETEWELEPATLETGEQVFNVFPLSGVPLIWDDGGNEQLPDPNPDSTIQRAFADGPFLKVPAVDRPKADEKVSQDND